PGEKMNTLQAAFADEMLAVFNQLNEQKKQLKGLVIHSLKPDNFIAGADVRMLDACTSAQEAQALATRGQQMFQQLEDLPFPVV
ncbi:enoyl-CoA hydratase-related protein, partial [Bacillus cereus group sp. BC328]